MLYAIRNQDDTATMTGSRSAKPTVVALMGPTAAGKTDAALGIAASAAVDLISVDSAMVYRRMDIGTAKPSAEVLARHPHALVNIRDPVDTYSAAHFVADADAAVRASLTAGRTPLLVGGTMLYFRAFKAGLHRLPGADPALRLELAAPCRKTGLAGIARRTGTTRPRGCGADGSQQRPTHPTRPGGSRTDR